MRKKTMYDILIQAVCIFCALLILFPILYAASVSFMEQKDVLSSPPNLLPPKPTLENYKTAFSRTMLLRYMLNSFIVASICSVARMVTATMAAFAFSFFEFKGKKLLFTLAMATIMIPPDVLIVSNFTTISRMGLINTYAGMCSIFLVSATNVFLLRQFYLSLRGRLRQREIFPLGASAGQQADYGNRIPLFLRQRVEPVRVAHACHQQERDAYHPGGNYHVKGQRVRYLRTGYGRRYCGSSADCASVPDFPEENRQRHDERFCKRIKNSNKLENPDKEDKTMKLKKMTAAAAAGVMALSLAGCAGGSGDSADKNAAVGTVNEDGTREVVFWHSMDGVYGEITQKQVDQFNETIGKEKKIHVTPVFQNWPGTEALTAAMSTDDVENMPDVIQLYGEHVSLVRDYERLVTAEEMLAGEGNSVSKEDLIPNAVSSFSINGKLAGLPWSTSTLLLYYNQDYLDQIGAQVPQTIDEMASILGQLKDETDAEYGLNVRVSLFELGNWIATQGQGTYLGDNESGHSDKMKTMACEEALDKYLAEWQKVVDTGAYKPTNDSINEEFAQGINAMAIMSSSRIPTIKELVGDSFNWGVAQIPLVTSDDIGGAYPSGSGLFLLNRGDDETVKAAWEFEQYMVSPEAQAMWLEGAGYVPVNKNSAELESYQNAIAETPQLAVPGEVMMKANEAVLAPFVPNSDAVDTTIKDAMLMFGNGQASAEDTKTAIIDGCNQIFNDYYRANGE